MSAVAIIFIPDKRRIFQTTVVRKSGSRYNRRDFGRTYPA
nr:MAG TPA: hypothetical protein [Caudoviricetes sp.]